VSSKIIRLGDVFRFAAKSKFKASQGKEEGKYKFFTSSPVQKKWIDEATFESESIIFGTGGSASVHYAIDKFSTSTDCLVAELDKEAELSIKYVYYFLLFNIEVLERGFKGAGLKHISKKYIEDIRIPAPSYVEQLHFVELFDKTLNIKNSREESITKLTQLMESIFFEMFVNPKIDSEKWVTTQVEFCAEPKKGSIRTGPFGSDLLHSEFTDTGIAVLGIDNAVKNYFSWSELRFISAEKYNQLKKYTVKAGDVLITIMGTCGRCAVVPNDIGIAINTKHLCCITLDESKCLPNFLHSYFLLHPTSRQYLSQTAKGAVMNGLNMGIIKAMPIVLPPLKLQAQYEACVKQINDQMNKQKLMLVECGRLLNSICEKVFISGL
jgi:type I restriction enzyme, S subunit